MKKKELRTTFDAEFLIKLKVEAAKRGLFMNELIEIAINEYLKEEEEDERI